MKWSYLGTALLQWCLVNIADVLLRFFSYFYISLTKLNIMRLVNAICCLH